MARTVKHTSYKDSFHPGKISRMREEEEFSICEMCGCELNLQEMKTGVCDNCMKDIDKDYEQTFEDSDTVI